MDVWTRVFNSDIRNFDEPGRWLQQPTTDRAEFAAALLRAVSEVASWAATEASDLDDPDSRSQLMESLAAMESALSVLRLGAAEAMTREAEDGQ